MAERHNVEADIIGGKFKINRVDQIKGNVGFMRADYTFGLAGGSGSVKQYPGIFRLDRTIRFSVR